MTESPPLRLVSYVVGGELRTGAITRDAAVVDLNEASGGMIPAEMLALIELGPDGLDAVRATVARADGRPLGEVSLAPPIPSPRRNVFAVGRNYAEHIAESARGRGIDAEVPDHVVFFTKPASALIGPYDDIELDESVTSQLDYEVELVAVIGRRGRDIPATRAMEHVWGYTVGNDVSARDLQSAHTQWFKGKALDHTSAIGPWVVPKEDAPHVADARVWLKVNDEPRQDSRTSLMIFSVETIVAQLSQGMSLEPGDLIMTGTPAGIGHRMSPPRYLRPGDVVEAGVDGVGAIRNRVRRIG